MDLIEKLLRAGAIVVANDNGGAFLLSLKRQCKSLSRSAVFLIFNLYASPSIVCHL